MFGLDVILYTRIKANIDPLNAEGLADRAIESAKRECGAKKKDGINHLPRAKGNGIRTPLSDEYEKKILERTVSKSLEEAWGKCGTANAAT